MAADNPSPGKTLPNDDVIAVSDEALLKAESFVEAEEGAANRLMGWAGRISTAIAVVMSLFHLYAAYAIVPTQELRYTHVAFTLVLSFLLFPLATRFRTRVRWWDIVPGLFAVATIVYALWGGDDFTDRATTPDRWDVIVGVVFIVLLLEATRRTTVLLMPVVSLLFIAYAMLGPHLPAPWTHRGYDLPRLIGHLFITLEGIFGVAVDVSATLIILFTIYGAFLQQSGAGKFFIDFSLALMGGKPNSAGRTVVLSSFLLGGPSGSGVVPAGAGRRRLPDRRVSENQLPRRDLDGDDSDLSLLSVAAVHGRTGRQEVRRQGRHVQTGNVVGRDDEALRLPLHLAAGRGRVHDRRVFAIAVGVLCDGGHPRAELPAQGDGAGAEEAGQGAGRRFDRRAERRHHLRLRRHRGRRRHPDRPWPQILVDRHLLCRRQPAADRDLHLADRMDHRPRGAGHGVLHHLRRDRGPRADKTRRAPLRRAHVHLLLRRAVGGVAADRAIAVRRRRHHRRRSLQDHAAIVEIHVAGVPGAVRVRARSAGRRPAAGDPEGRVMGRYRRNHHQDHLRAARAGRVCPELGAATKYAGRTRPASAMRIAAGVSELDRGGHRIDHRP